MLKLNLACGNDYRDGWVNVDRDARTKADLYHDLTMPLPFNTDSVDVIVANHIIEHLPVESFIPFMNECHRVLKPGCVLHIETPSPMCEFFWQDPTHVRGYTRNTFTIYFRYETFGCYGIKFWSKTDAREEHREENNVPAIVIYADLEK